mmetsp:Transcript_19326/g.13984  ORF Transcript_19326/g.13984 Transcript_19326/m.13984 type:complete len:121 (-) Transcript_19326:663-1025(-)|eukprot:CAMPEP_0202978762 /NCGR_PEP_ID=MMETSP1396-20130829/85088_1 /ASSEMBLY_ACC=CAM_ASM_000872 /TAXON_ID= /ORGANISM="Pseudokeronopsis sp., Strain Brazil" /LENGTH=120 /DNA_ID=CAMNT_0049717865 /DNA_START=2166 /DNA_END=2528 /DNA_ORIENTATION=-
MIQDLLQEYCDGLVKNLDKVFQFKSMELVFPLNLQARRPRGAGFHIYKKQTVQEQNPEAFKHLIAMGSNNWVDYILNNGGASTLELLLTRLANLGFLKEQIDLMKEKYFKRKPGERPFNA